MFSRLLRDRRCKGQSLARVVRPVDCHIDPVHAYNRRVCRDPPLASKRHAGCSRVIGARCRTGTRQAGKCRAGHGSELFQSRLRQIDRARSQMAGLIGSNNRDGAYGQSQNSETKNRDCDQDLD